MTGEWPGMKIATTSNKEMNMLTNEEIEARYTAFMVECERINHGLDCIMQSIDEWEAEE